jgi:excisionase family DNA binding protein
MANLPPMPPATDRLLLKPREAAYLLGCSVSALYKRVEDGLIPHHNEGRRLVFFCKELEAYVAALPGTTLEAAQAQLERLRKMRQ